MISNFFLPAEERIETWNRSTEPRTEQLCRKPRRGAFEIWAHEQAWSVSIDHCQPDLFAVHGGTDRCPGIVCPITRENSSFIYVHSRFYFRKKWYGGRIQLPLKSFARTSVSSLIRPSWHMQDRTPLKVWLHKVGSCITGAVVMCNVM